jgi:hypothetical protein
VRQRQVADAQAAQRAQHAERSGDAVPALGAEQRRHPAGGERGLGLVRGGGEREVARVALGEPVHELHLLQHRGHRVGAGEGARYVHRPELDAHPAGAQPWQVGVQRGGPTGEVRGGRVGIAGQAQRPGQVVVPVDERGGGEQRLGAGEVVHPASLPVGMARCSPVDSARDRDPAGRPRNARPRDAAGRPLPHGAQGVERVPEDLVLSADDSVTEAQRLLDEGLPFPAHDVLEAAWKAAPEGERELWRGLAQLAVGLTHAQRGNAKGAAALLERAADRIGAWAAPAPAGIDVAGLQAHAHTLARRIAQEGLAGLSDADLRLRLRGA